MQDKDLANFFLLREKSGGSSFSLPEISLFPPIDFPSSLAMHLVACARPVEPLEDAPRSSLLLESGTGSWTGFWSTIDEVYYARFKRTDGAEEWFRLSEEGLAAAGPEIARAGALTPVLSTPIVRTHGVTRAAQARRRVMLLLARSSSARGILVGNARPKVR